MRKSLGEKRKQISDEQIETITHLYADFTSGEKVKIMSNESFGYMRVTVERPLRVKWCLNEAALANLEKSKAWKAWAKAGNTSTADETFGPNGDLGDIWQAVFDSDEDLKTALKGKPAGAVPEDVVKALVEAARMSDTDGVVVKDKKGNIQPDADLRDNENVPLPPIAVTWSADVAERLAAVEDRTAVDEYVEAEVHPYVPDAWVDFEKTKIGYEVPLSRHFYTYVPPRPLGEIDVEIKQLEAEIQALLREVAE